MGFCGRPSCLGMNMNIFLWVMFWLLQILEQQSFSFQKKIISLLLGVRIRLLYLKFTYKAFLFLFTWRRELIFRSAFFAFRNIQIKLVLSFRFLSLFKGLLFFTILKVFFGIMISNTKWLYLPSFLFFLLFLFFFLFPELSTLLKFTKTDFHAFIFFKYIFASILTKVFLFVLVSLSIVYLILKNRNR